MVKKIFDIIPPEKNFLSSPVEEIAGDREHKGEKPKKSQKRKIVLIFIGIFVFFFVTSANFVFFEFNFEILPKIETVSFEQSVVIEPGGAVSAEVFEEEKEFWQEFPSTGIAWKQERAKGIIQVYNAHNPPESLTLRPETRFLSDSGKYFYSPKRIYIPPAKIKKGKVIPSFVEIEVLAMEPGEEYNIKPATFSVPGLVGTSYYYTTYARSFSDMSGGFKKQVKQVTQEDLDKAKHILEEKAIKQAELSLRDKIPSGFILLDKALTQKIIESSSLVKPGTELETFNYSVKTCSKALAFKESELEEFVKQFVLSQISESKELVEHSLAFEYSVEEIDIEAEKIVLNLKISSNIYSKIDFNALKELVKGKSIEEAESILRAQPEIQEAKIKFFPFWFKKIPQDTKRIKVKLKEISPQTK